MSKDASQDFCDIAVQYGMLSTEAAKKVTLDAETRKLPASQCAHRAGLLTEVQIDVVEMLCHPLEAVPGYELLSLIGQGGMGVVFRARQISLNRQVALKTVLVGGQEIGRFEQEAQTVGRLLHPHIVAAHDFGRVGGRLFFAMELVEGEDAEQYVRRVGPLSDINAWGLIRQAATGLMHAAEFHIVHRDIKPANLLLVTPPRGYPLLPGLPMVKIADFGLAFLTEQSTDKTRLTSDQTTVGSPHYMAPEQLANSVVDSRADIYALGATAYHLLAGRPPFDGKTVAQVVFQKLQGKPIPLSQLRPDLKSDTLTLIDNMLQADPEQRIGSYPQLLDRLDLLDLGTPSVSTVVLPMEAIVDEGHNQRRPREIPRLRLADHEAPTLVTMPTVAQPVKPPKSAAKPRRALLVAGLALLGVLTVAGAAFGLRGSLWPTPPELTATGNSVELFNGRSLDGWMIAEGSWHVEADEEGSPVVSGSGVLRRRLPEAKDAAGSAVPLRWFRLEFAATLNTMAGVETHFAIQPGPDGRRAVVRVTANDIVLGERQGDRGPLTALRPAIPHARPTETRRVIRIERQVREWRVHVDEELLGTIPASSETLPEFRLVTDRPASPTKSKAWFSDLVIDALGVPPATTPKK